MFSSKMLTEPFVYARLPHAGLGNMLLVWASAYVFSKKQKLSLVISSWSKFRFRHWLRRYADKRLYLRSLRSSSLLEVLFCEWCILRAKGVISEPVDVPTDFRLAVFAAVPHWRDYFGVIRQYRDLGPCRLFCQPYAEHSVTGQFITRTHYSGDYPQLNS
jgi:hypothetical protein